MQTTRFVVFQQLAHFLLFFFSGKYLIERILIFGWIEIGTIYSRKGSGFAGFSNFSTLLLKF